MLSGNFEDLWNSGVDFMSDDPEPQWCGPARQFIEWIDTEVYQALVSGKPDVVSINQAKILLADKYFELRSFANWRHRDRLGTRGHTCIYQVFIEALGSLIQAGFLITPPMLFIPGSSAPSSVPLGTLIGLEEIE